MSDGFKYTLANLQIKMKNIEAHHPTKKEDLPEYQRAYETLIHHS
jgi:hypothetical protein